MKPIFFFLSGLLLLSAGTACDKDDDDQGGEPQIAEGFWYDGANFTAPFLSDDIFETAARFPSNIMGQFANKNLSALHVNLYGRPFNTEIRVYANGTGDEPGNLLYSEAVSRGGLTENTWNRIDLTTPLPLDGSGIWVSFRFEVGSNQIQSVGCDSGPRNPDGDRFFANGTWTTFQSFAGGESINWNIRMEVE